MEFSRKRIVHGKSGDMFIVYLKDLGSVLVTFSIEMEVKKVSVLFLEQPRHWPGHGNSTSEVGGYEQKNQKLHSRVSRF